MAIALFTFGGRDQTVPERIRLDHWARARAWAGGQACLPAGSGWVPAIAWREHALWWAWRRHQEPAGLLDRVPPDRGTGAGTSKVGRLTLRDCPATRRRTWARASVTRTKSAPTEPPPKRCSRRSTSRKAKPEEPRAKYPFVTDPAVKDMDKRLPPNRSRSLSRTVAQHPLT
jgi:hypothetical protein